MPYNFADYSHTVTYYSGKQGKVAIEIQLDAAGNPVASVFVIFKDGFGHEVPSVVEALLLLDVIS